MVRSCKWSHLAVAMTMLHFYTYQSDIEIKRKFILFLYFLYNKYMEKYIIVHKYYYD